MPAAPVPVAELATAVQARLGRPVVADGWRPAVQGAVAHVAGLRAADGTPYAVKVFPADAGRRVDTELLALRLAGGLPGVPVPELVLHGELAGRGARYLVTTRLPGMRWSDRRDELDAADTADLHRDVARLLHQLHSLGGERFGDLLDDGPRWDTAWERVAERCGRSVDEYMAFGGPLEVAGLVQRFVDGHRDAFDADLHPVLCHHDLNGGNVLVAAERAPRITGLVDFERASWDDPLADLALDSASRALPRSGGCRRLARGVRAGGRRRAAAAPGAPGPPGARRAKLGGPGPTGQLDRLHGAPGRPAAHARLGALYAAGSQTQLESLV